MRLFGDELRRVNKLDLVRRVVVNGHGHEHIGAVLDLLDGGLLFDLIEGLRVCREIESACGIERRFVFDFDGVDGVLLRDCQGDHLLSRMIIAGFERGYREDKKLFLYQVDKRLTKITKSSMISGSRDMKLLDGLTIVAAFGAEENELASERVGSLKSQLDFVIEVGFAIEEAATLVIDLFEKAVSLNHGGYSVSSPVATPVSSGLAKAVSTV